MFLQVLLQMERKEVLPAPLPKNLWPATVAADIDKRKGKQRYTDWARKFMEETSTWTSKSSPDHPYDFTGPLLSQWLPDNSYSCWCKGYEIRACYEQKRPEPVFSEKHSTKACVGYDTRAAEYREGIHLAEKKA